MKLLIAGFLTLFCEMMGIYYANEEERRSVFEHQHSVYLHAVCESKLMQLKNWYTKKIIKQTKN